MKSELVTAPINTPSVSGRKLDVSRRGKKGLRSSRDKNASLKGPPAVTPDLSSDYQNEYRIPGTYSVQVYRKEKKKAPMDAKIVNGMEKNIHRNQVLLGVYDTPN